MEPRGVSMEPVQNKNLVPHDGCVHLYDGFLSPSDCDRWRNDLFKAVPWEQRSIKMFGRSILQPRLTAWYGDPGCSYKYSGLLWEPTPWLPSLLEIKRQVELFTRQKFNSALLNLYRHENDSMGLHNDNEKELGQEPFIASVSLGATRKITFSPISNKQERMSFNLENGSLLTMEGPTQKHWKHAIPKQSQTAKMRINITFRNIMIQRPKGQAS